MDAQSKFVATTYANLRKRSGVTLKVEASHLGLKGPSSVQRYGDIKNYNGGYLSWEMVRKLMELWVGKGSPPIKQSDVLVLGGPDQLQVRKANAAGEVSMTGPANMKDMFEFLIDEAVGDPAAQSINEVNGERKAQGIPKGAIAEVDVSGGLGAGGVGIEFQATGRNGMTFSADSVRDYWRLPDWILSAINAKSTNVAAIPTKGDSMEPTLYSGDVVFVDLTHRIPSPEGLYAIVDEFGGVVVKRLEVEGKDEEGDVWIVIIPDNPRHSRKREKASELQIIGRVAGRFAVM